MTWICQSCEATSAGVNVRPAAPRALICSWCADELAKRAHGFCRKCRQPRPLPFGTAHHGAWCRECDRTYMRAKYERNRDTRLAYQSAYQVAHRARLIERHRAYRVANRERINARKRKYAAAHPGARRASDARWRANHRRVNNPEYGRIARARRKLAILWGRR